MSEVLFALTLVQIVAAGNIGGKYSTFLSQTVSNHQYILCFPVFDESGSMFHPDDPLVLRAEGLEKPRKKRGRPKKAQSEPDISTDNSTSNTGYSEIAPVDSETKRDDKHDKDEDLDGRRRRKRKVPQR